MKAPKKLIEVALPLDDINREAAREKSIRHGHPSTLHLWWARRPLAAGAGLVDPTDDLFVPSLLFLVDNSLRLSASDSSGQRMVSRRLWNLVARGKCSPYVSPSPKRFIPYAIVLHKQ